MNIYEAIHRQQNERDAQGLSWRDYHDSRTIRDFPRAQREKHW